MVPQLFKRSSPTSFSLYRKALHFLFNNSFYEFDFACKIQEEVLSAGCPSFCFIFGHKNIYVKAREHISLENLLGMERGKYLWMGE